MPLKTPNIWVVFVKRIEDLIKTIASDEVVRLQCKPFASALKDEKPHTEWTDAEILAKFETWERPTARNPSRNPSSNPSRAPNQWQLFMARVRIILKSVSSQDPALKKSAQKVMKFAIHLKSKSASYQEWTEEQIVAEFRNWR